MWILLVIVIATAIVIAFLAGTGRIDDIITAETTKRDDLDAGRGYTFFIGGDYFHLTAKSDDEAWEKARRITGSNKNVRMLER